MSDERPYIDYYERLGETPVAQNITDLRQHFERRAALYQLLGIPPRFFALSEILEFGPGLGHNAIHVASLRPKRHVLVDGSRTSVEGLARTFASNEVDPSRYEIVPSDVEAFRSEAPFDIVLAENLIPMQKDPRSFVRTIASHVRPGGVLVVTCTDAVSFIGEMLRRVVAMKIAPTSLPVEERVARLRKLFATHLARLPGVTRSSEDWIRDNVTQPLFGSFFSIEDAVAALDDDFDVYGGSPHFFLDWRWYKEVHGERRRFNERAVLAYRENLINFLDWRILAPPAGWAYGQEIKNRCDALWAALRAAEESPASFDAPAFASRCEALADETRSLSDLTARSIAEVAAFLRAPKDAEPARYFDEFSAHFGRGAQYLSLIRR